jgi:hypothetical protein
MAPGGSITYYNTTVPGTIPDDYVQAIEIDSAGNVWFGSFAGLTRYSPATGAWRTWTKADGLPAASVQVITFDNAGGVWLGFYPDREGDEYQIETIYRGGYAYMDAGGTITAWVLDEHTEGLSPWYLGDYWVRSIAVDGDGGAWIVRASAFMPHVGGRVDHVAPDKQSVYSWTGHELLGEAALPGPAEIRMVAVDRNGGVWLGASGTAGLFHMTTRYLASGEAPSILHRRYNATNNAWPGETPMDNIQYLRFFGDTLYAGSNGGIAWADVALAPVPPSPPNPDGALPDTPFADVGTDDWFYDAVQYFYERGIIESTSDNMFNPGSSITRGMVVTMLYRLEGEPDISSASTFTDISFDAFYTDALTWAQEIGLVGGYGDGRFGSGDFMTRQDIAVILTRYADLAGIALHPIREGVEFRDADRIAGYAAEAVIQAFVAGIIDDRGNGAFDPIGTESRAEFIVMLLRLLG